MAYSEGLQQTFPEITFYQWNERQQTFEEVSGNTQTEGHLIFGYFDRSSSQKLFNWKLENEVLTAQNQNLEFTLSATDANENEVLDGTEGLNLIINTLSESFTRQQFIEHFEGQVSEIDIYPVLYETIRNEDGELIFSALQPEDEIQPGATFALLSNEPFQPQQVSLSGEDLLAQRPDDEEDKERDDRSFFRIISEFRRRKKGVCQY